MPDCATCASDRARQVGLTGGGVSDVPRYFLAKTHHSQRRRRRVDDAVARLRLLPRGAVDENGCDHRHARETYAGAWSEIRAVDEEKTERDEQPARRPSAAVSRILN